MRCQRPISAQFSFLCQVGICFKKTCQSQFYLLPLSLSAKYQRTVERVCTFSSQLFLRKGIIAETMRGEPQIVPVPDHVLLMIENTSFEVDDGFNTKSVSLLHGDIVTGLFAERIRLDIKGR